MDHFRYGLLMIVFMIPIHCLHISDDTDFLHQMLSEFDVVRPIRTNSEGRFLPATVSGLHLPRRKRHYASPRPPRLEGTELFYNVTVFGQELHLRLRPNGRLVAPTAIMEWWEESGHKTSQPIRDTDCLYTGEVSNMEDASIAISNCDGLAGVIRTSQEEFFIEPLNPWRTRGKEEEEKGDRPHIVYRSSAVIKNQSAINQTAHDFVRGPLLGSLDWNQTMKSPGSARRKRYIEEAELFNIEVLLAVDYSVLLFHGRDHIQKYLLTLMNILNEIYQDHSLGANINVVLVRIIMLSPSKSQELISVGNPQKSLENVCGWSYLQHREQNDAEQHDHTIYLTRQEFGPSGMQGYAPVEGMCQLHRSCVLVFEDGFSSAFVAAHETGHVLGMQHDGEANDCADDVPMGSIMSPRVQATFQRYHWSRCSWRELHQHLQTYDCLRDDPFNHDWPAQPPLPGFQYSMDQQCRFDFGPGYSLCTVCLPVYLSMGLSAFYFSSVLSLWLCLAFLGKDLYCLCLSLVIEPVCRSFCPKYATHDPCKQLLCSEYNNPFHCKTKKGPPLDGTKCGPGKHCFKGFCLKLTPDMLRQDGGWGAWSPFGVCSRTCGGGVRFRARRCDSPAPANGGRTCFGNSYEFQMCSQGECPPLTDFREDQCKLWNPFLEHEGRKHHWLPYQHPDPDERCILHCQSKETAAVVSINRMVHDGTPCSYGDAHSVCVRGECEHVGCDGQIASDKQEDRCGVCGGDNSSCKIIKGNFTRSTKKQGYLKILEIPKGARHLLIQEFKGTPHILALTNQETGELFLNSEDKVPASRVVIQRGVFWEYKNTEEQESVQTTGPLTYDVLLLVRSHGDSKLTVSYKYIIQDGLRSLLESNLLQDDGVFYEWALKKWSHCSKPCGGGKQYTRFGCRRKADGKMVQRTFCSKTGKPRAISRSCSTDTCNSPRWLTGEWQDCSATCGQTGWQRRWVSCQQTSSRGQHSVPSKLCGEERPEGKQTCNRFPCPASWRAGPWTPCSVSCGNGTQERQVACLSPDGSARNCSDFPPIKTRNCHPPPCSGDQKNAIIQWLSRSNPDFSASKIFSSQRCRGDRSVFCRMEVLSRYCSITGYRQMCCKSCSEGNLNNPIDSSNSTKHGKSGNWGNSGNYSTSSDLFPQRTTSSAWSSSTEAMTSPMTSSPTPSWSDNAYITSEVISRPTPSLPGTPPLTSGSGEDFVYVEYNDYNEYYEDPSIPSDTTTSTTACTTSSTPTTTTTRKPRRNAPPHLFKRTTPTMPPATAFVVIAGTQSATAPPPTTPSTDPNDVFTVTLGGRSLRTGAKPLQTSSSFFPLSKRENSVDVVPYRIVGLDHDTTGEINSDVNSDATDVINGDVTGAKQSYFVPRMPPIRERTQNKRIQQLLNEKRRKDVAKRAGGTRGGQTRL
ncbi:A disintegrin and metalloproteinase with thrombospondin motifs 2 isoform X2 [Gasterosteus aculeatus]